MRFNFSSRLWLTVILIFYCQYSTAQITGRGRVKIYFDNFKCLNPTTDDMLEADGKGDEVYFTFLYSVADSTGKTKSRGKITTKTYGDRNGFPGRIKAGSLSPRGGIKRGDIILSQSDADDTLLTVGFDRPLYEARKGNGTLILDRQLENGDFITLFPIVWEWDHVGPSVESELEAFFLNSMDSINRKSFRWYSQFPKEHQYKVRGMRIIDLIDTNRVKYILRNIKDKPATRPVGFTSSGLFPAGNLFTKMYDKARIAAYFPTREAAFRLQDHLYYDPMHDSRVLPERHHPNGDYEIIVQATFEAMSTGTAPPPGKPLPPTEIKPPVPIRDSIRIIPGTEPGKDTLPVTGQILDADGNAYTTLTIGKLRWMRENLRTTKYNDGTPIAGNLSNAAWENTREGAFAIYENNSQYDLLYGKLYNGYAVTTGKLCPKGWRVPADSDWQQLERIVGIIEDQLGNIGGRGRIAGALKEPGLWDPSGEPGDNSTGFSVRPAGVRSTNGEFTVLKQYGDFWTSTVYENPYSLYLWNRHFYYNSLEIGRNYLSANNGYSCRCVQDIPK